MKGVVLAAGNGTRLRPLTNLVSKSTLLIHDKPLIYFPISTLIGIGVEDIIIHTRNTGDYQKFLSDEKLRAEISYDVEENPHGIAAALFHMRNKIKNAEVLVILGDMYLTFKIDPPTKHNACCIYLSTNFEHNRISEYGVAELDSQGSVLSFEEKPPQPKGNHIHLGTTYFPSDLVHVLCDMGAIEGKNLTDIAIRYHKQGRLTANTSSGRWFNVNTPKDLSEAIIHRRNIWGAI